MKWLFCAGVSFLCVFGYARQELKIGSKAFTESVILGEIIKNLADSAGVKSEHIKQLGGTQIVWKALLKGEVDIYPEYTGTITEEIFAKRSLKTEDDIRNELAKNGITMSAPLGYNNTYALGIKEAKARQLNIRTISDLRRYPQLVFRMSSEFMDRKDGWPALKERYQLPQADIRGVEHALAYKALNSGDADVTDLYSTDAEIQMYGLRVLEDDLRYFPKYDAVLLYRSELEKEMPKALRAITKLTGKIDEPTMVALNYRAKAKREPESSIGADFASKLLTSKVATATESRAARILARTVEHLRLVSISLLAAIIVAIPLGIAAWRNSILGQGILGIVGMIQTIPSLALLVFLIPILGLRDKTAVVALFLYSLLPIVRNTYTGLHDISPQLRESAEALGLTGAQRLRLIYLPLASRAILAGIKTAAVINVGTATLGALIGAGGYGQPIFTGIRSDDMSMVLEGAIPAAILAIVVQLVFEALERAVVPRGLRLKISR